jgi:hypothetical protein
LNVKKICSVLYVIVLMDVNILKTMFKNKLVKLLSKIPPIKLPFYKYVLFHWSVLITGCRENPAKCMYMAESPLKHLDFIIDFFNNKATTNFETISIRTVLPALKNTGIHLAGLSL